MYLVEVADGIYGKSGKKVDQIGIYCYPNSMFE